VEFFKIISGHHIVAPHYRDLLCKCYFLDDPNAVEPVVAKQISESAEANVNKAVRSHQVKTEQVTREGFLSTLPTEEDLSYEIEGVLYASRLSKADQHSRGI